MSYLLKKLNELEDFTPEKVKTMLFREGFVDSRVELKYEIYQFYTQRLAYYKRQKLNNPKTQARFESQKAFGVGKDLIYSAIEVFG